MNNVLIIIDGILAKHFLERLCFENGLGYFFTIISPNALSIELSNTPFEIHHFDPTSRPRLELIMKDYKLAFIYMRDKFNTQKSYEALRSLDLNLEIDIMDFWGLSFEDKNCHIIDGRTTLTKRLVDYLPDIAKTAQYIGLGTGEIMDVKIPIGSIFAYRHISSIQQKRWRIVLIYRDSKINFVRPSFVLQPNDRILIVGDPIVLQNVFRIIKANEGQFPVPFGSNIFTLIDMVNMSEKTQILLIKTSLYLRQKTNAKKAFIRVINPTLNENYSLIKKLIDENENIIIDYKNTKFNIDKERIKNHDIGLFLTDTNHFEKFKKSFFELKIPILKVGEIDFEEVRQSVILSANESELENQANVIIDLSKQLNLSVNLHYYNPNIKDTSGIKEYFASLSKLYEKHININDKNDINPLLTLCDENNLLHFVFFEKKLLKSKIHRNLSVNLNKHYYKMSKNYQLFIPAD
ncbi:COG3400 family protein [Campylobacter sp. LR286c]|uniref:COG3400 family protein n=1 Tax=Campylobacter sp. LR286c TaxID=2593545 RepID=UPI001237D086|nr:TrkA C-terminal domain-containing protein [Campylobacter sp. LR286c]KAA6226412.1 potassium transporter TrkA [Campylobacter sp. LR286c]